VHAAAPLRPRLRVLKGDHPASTVPHRSVDGRRPAVAVHGRLRAHSRTALAR